MLALFPTIPEIQRPKAPKIDVLDYPTVEATPLPLEYPHKTYIVRNEKLESLGFIYAADSVGLSSFKFSLYMLRETPVLCNGVCNGRSRSSKVIDFGATRKRICDLLLVIHSITVSEILQVFCREQHPHPIPPEFWGVPLGL